jgi:ribose 5-phosphate isomerase B
MRIHIGSDHAGLELKAALVEYLQSKGHDVKDHGPHEYDAVDDYPDFCIPAAIAAVADPASLGIVLGGSGNGEQIAANKVKGVRAVLAWSVETAKLGRDHNNANVVGIGGRMHSIEDCKAIMHLSKHHFQMMSAMFEESTRSLSTRMKVHSKPLCTSCR